VNAACHGVVHIITVLCIGDAEARAERLGYTAESRCENPLGRPGWAAVAMDENLRLRHNPAYSAQGGLPWYGYGRT
jgi:hypothetical protein